MLDEKRRSGVVFLDEIKKEITRMEKKWNNDRQDLLAIKEDPNFLKYFSAKEIMEVNETERGISRMLQSITNLRKSINFEYFELIIIPEDFYVRELKKINMDYLDIKIFVEKMKLKILPLWRFLLFYPVRTMKIFINEHLRKKAIGI